MNINSQTRKPYFIWGLFVVTTLMGVASFFLFLRNASTLVPASWGVDSGNREGLDQLFNALQQNLISPALIGFLGALILTQRPAHRIGRLLVLLGFVLACMGILQEWSVYSYFTLQTNLPLAGIAAWITNWLWVILFGLLILTAAIFPNGQFLSRRWRWIIGVPLFFFVVPIWLGAMVETPMSSAFQIPNPFVKNHPKVFYNIVFVVGVTAMVVTVIVVLASSVMRFRVSRARERQQMKWLMFGVAVMTLLTVVGFGFFFSLDSNLGGIMVNAAVIGPILGIGVALLRHRLYDIDIIIRRTMQYTSLTGLLALIYFGSVIFLQAGVGTLTGQTNSPMITVLTTLGIAALFNPLRIRVQGFIDRRFYRKKYDAEQALAQFAAIIRDEVDMHKLADALIGVVEETMQPESVSLWIKPIKVRKSQDEPY